MSVVFAMMLLLFSLGWGSVLIVRSLQRSDQQLHRGPSEDVRQLIDAVDDLSSRVSLLEEERDFYRELAGGEEPGRLGSEDATHAHEKGPESQ